MSDPLPQRGYYRYPTIHGADLTFVCEDDLWTVTRQGGIARRLTAGPGTTTFPAYSPDGRYVAYTSSDDGPAEAYVIPAQGGAARRLTFFGAVAQVTGWTADGTAVVVASNWRQPFTKCYGLYRIGLDGAPPARIDVGPARALSYQPGGPGMVIGRNSGDPARWKRYRGGTAGTLWVDRNGDGKFAPLIELPGNLASPMWIGTRIYFLSDHEGFGNIYSCTPTGRDLQRHTHREDFYVRFPSTDRTLIAYQGGADLHLFDPTDGSSRRVDVQIHSAQAGRRRRFVPATPYLESYDLHPEGHSAAITTRGGVYVMGLWEGMAIRLGDGQGDGKPGRHRLGRFLPDGRVVAVSDASGEESLVLLDTLGNTEELVGGFGRAIDLEVDPTGKHLALTNERFELYIVPLKGKRRTLRLVERSDWERIEGVAWSPDGRYLAYGLFTSRRSACIRLYDVTSKRAVSITRDGFRDGDPAFDPEGKYLYFLSWRVFDPVYDNHYFDLGFPRGAKPFLIPLAKDTVSPFNSGTRPPRPPMPEDGDDKPADGKPQKRKPPATAIDLDGILDRVQAFPVPEAIYGQVAGVRGQAVFTSFPIEGSLDRTWMDAEPAAEGYLECFELERQRADLIVEGMTDFRMALQAPVIAVRVGNRLRVVHASSRAERRPDRDEPSRETGWIDLSRLRVEVHPPAEWRQMFHEAWRLQRDHFWTQDMAAIDWQAVHDRYLPLVDRVDSRAEFSDLVWEMQGELGTSHCYELGGDYRPSPRWFQGLLGADLEVDRRTGRWRIARIPKGDSWDPEQSSPLLAPGLGLGVGDELVAIDGHRVGRERSPEQLLVNLAGQEVALTVRSKGKGKRAAPERTVIVTTLRDETPLRYRDWVETNLAYVHEASKGKVGYVHVPNMGPVGFAEFHRYFSSEVDRDGLIIDVRWNGGGHVSQLLLEKLMRRRVGYNRPRWGQSGSYPTDAPMGPMVAVTNEQAGSDGDIFSHCFKLYGLGPLIGKRTWGGVVGIWPRHALVDGTVTTQAEFATWFEDVGWGVENYGTDPDIEVEIQPQDHAAGKDPQLDRALAEIGAILKKRPTKLPKLDQRPQLRPGRLPALPVATPTPRRKRS